MTIMKFRQFIKYSYIFSSVLLFVLFIASVGRMGLGVKSASALKNEQKETWVDGTVYYINSQGNKEYLSANPNCGLYTTTLLVSNVSVNKCSGEIPYYLIPNSATGTNFSLNLENEYRCNSWVAVNADDPSEIIDYGNCVGLFHNEADIDNPLNKGLTLWWKVDKKII
jgi:hypothetical protein